MKQVTNSSGTNWVINYSSIFWFSVSLSCSCSDHLTIKHVRTRNHFRKAISSPLITFCWDISPTSNKTLIWNVFRLHWSHIQCHLWQSWHISYCKDSYRLPKLLTRTTDIPIRDAHSLISSISLRLPEDRCTYFPGHIILANPLTARRQN